MEQRQEPEFRTGPEIRKVVEMKNSKELSGLDSHVSILNFDFCLLNSGFTLFILTPDF
ncbi:MAG: hypothetical protein WCV67_06035 [Victivallaceae bacterium]